MLKYSEIMAAVGKLFLIFALCNYCQGVSIQEQMDHIAMRKHESLGLASDFAPAGRRTLRYEHGGPILGVPSLPSHLPEAEAMLPGHTLIRPAFGMLKSAIKFPHIDMEGGAGVYGNMDNLGLAYDGRNERLMYSNSRRKHGKKPKKEERSTSSSSNDRESDETSEDEKPNVEKYLTKIVKKTINTYICHLRTVDLTIKMRILRNVCTVTAYLEMENLEECTTVQRNYILMWI